MPKIKTHKSTAKRFSITKTKKIIRRKSGQDHFNSRERGAITRRKRRDLTVHQVNTRTIRRQMPYN